MTTGEVTARLQKYGVYSAHLHDSCNNQTVLEKLRN